MCTDEQWTTKHPTKTLMTSAYWLKDKNTETFDRKQHFSFWLTPLGVPPSEVGWFMQFPSFSSPCSTHVPAKLK